MFSLPAQPVPAVISVMEHELCWQSHGWQREGEWSLLPLGACTFPKWFFFELVIICRHNPKGFVQVTLPWDMQRLFLKCKLFPFPFLSESCGSFTRGG